MVTLVVGSGHEVGDEGFERGGVGTEDGSQLGDLQLRCFHFFDDPIDLFFFLLLLLLFFFFFFLLSSLTLSSFGSSGCAAQGLAKERERGRRVFALLCFLIRNE